MAGADVNPGTTFKKILLALNCIILTIGTAGSPLITRLYYVHGGNRIWFASWLQSAGCPIIAIPLAISYIHRRHRWATKTCEGGAGASSLSPRPVLMKPFLFVVSAVVGLITGFDNFLYASGLARLPVSTSSLIIATQLAFTAAFAFLLVKQRFTPYSLNAVFLLTVGAVVLALHSGSDRPEGESDREYMVGFLMMAAAAALYGFLLPLVEFTYQKARQVITYSLVLEYQLVMCLFATAFCTVGMWINDDFRAIAREARQYRIGEFKYYMVLVWTAILSQCFFLGAIGAIFCASSLFSGIIVAVMLPVTEVLAVIFFKEKFQAEKGVSLALSIWGFISYFYGEIRQTKKRDVDAKNEYQSRPLPSEMEMNGSPSLPYSDGNHGV